MALITGSSTIDWSGVSLAQVDFEGDIVNFVNRVDQILADDFRIVFVSPTLLVAELASGGTLRIGGSGFDTPTPIINSFKFFSNTATGEVIRFTGTLTQISEVLTSATIGSTGFSETINGNITVLPADTYRGRVTSLVARIWSGIGFTKIKISGSFNLTGDLSSASLTGTVTGISVKLGKDTINMTGLSLSLDEVEAALASGDLATVNDLFSFVGNHLSGNDTITYANNTGAGMSFFGGPGHDTITISGPNADTLNGGEGNDNLNGGLGQDTVMGGLGDDQITMLVTAGDEDTVDAGEGNDTLILKGVVPGDGVVVVDLSSATDQVVSIGGLADALTQMNFENLNASGIGSSVNVTGSAGDNIIIGSKGNDHIDGGAGNDRMTGGAGNETYTVDSAGDIVIEALNGGTDTVVSSISYMLGANVENLTLTGSDHLNGTGNALANVLTGNDGDNILTGKGGRDQLTGGDGNDTLVGGGGRDTVQGGAGDDLVLLASVAEFAAGEVIDGGAGTDTLRYTGNLAATLTLTNLVTNMERVEIANAAGDASGIAAVNVNAAAVANSLTLIGNHGANVLTGTSQADTFIGNGGNDRLAGGLGNDTYKINPGDGRDRIFENDSTAGNSDTLLYGATINPLDLVLSRQVNDLRIAVHGTTDRVTIQNWYADPAAAQVETIQADGQTLPNTQVDILIQAMAQFTTDTGLSWGAAIAGGGTAQQQAQFQAIIAANWQ